MKGDELFVFCILVVMYNMNFDAEAYTDDFVSIFIAMKYIFNLLVGVMIMSYFRR